MTDFSRVVLKPKRARPFFGRHPWVFDGAIARVEGSAGPGKLVRVVSHEQQFIAWGLFNPHSAIRVRLYSWDEARPVDAGLIAERIASAVALRRDVLGLNDPRGACRLVFSESDGLSGLIVDRYADLLAIQFTSLALAQYEREIVHEFERLLAPRGIVRRTERSIGELEGLEAVDEPISGDVPSDPIVVVENDTEFLVDLTKGQKTGYFLDQRENRLALCRYTRGRSILDVFCYTGGFSLTAMRRGRAAAIFGIDVSAAAISLAKANAERQAIAAEFRQAEALPALAELRREGRRFGVVVCDPPKFTRTAESVHRAARGYEQLNRSAIDLVEPGGILLTCSCSGHVSAEEFIEIVAAAARQSGRTLQLLEQRGQPPDHPVSLFCLESAYLKCLICRVTD